MSSTIWWPMQLREVAVAVVETGKQITVAIAATTVTVATTTLTITMAVGVVLATVTTLIKTINVRSVGS
jgi:hypothetical protein